MIAGLGLIGGSIGIALRRAGWRVSFDDPNVALDEARAAGAADDDDRQGADVVILAMPVDAAVSALSSQLSALRTSVCSVMLPLRAAADANGISFVAGHPLAGSERRGLAGRAAICSWEVVVRRPRRTVSCRHHRGLRSRAERVSPKNMTARLR